MALFADLNDLWTEHKWMLIGGAVVLLLGIFFLIVFFSFLRCGSSASSPAPRSASGT
ncbi:MAG: hypothetical protein U0793_11430 [Gemmataceae bacterium]